MLDCPDLAVPREVMQHVVHVESSRNPFAIGVVGGYLARQPKSLEEALATVRQLKEDGYNFSVGVSQVNRYNLAKYGIRTYAEAFEVCPNLQAGSRILRECYDRAQDWGKAFSCYYSGNFVTGFEHGYVQKIFASIRLAQAGPSSAEAIRVIPYGNAPRRPARDDGLAVGGSPSYPEPGAVRQAATASPASLDTAEARPAVPVPGPGAVMPGPSAAQKPKALDLSQIPTQVVGVNGDPYQTKVLPVSVPAGVPGDKLPLPKAAELPDPVSDAARGRGLKTRSAASLKGGSLLSPSESSFEAKSNSSAPGVDQKPARKSSPSDSSFVF